MMDKDKLRKADIFSGGVIFLVGCFVVSQALKMPMKDSWGGVQNVWYVSPAIFPLFVGAMIMLLGALLIRTALKEVGIEGFKSVLSFIGSSSELVPFLKLDANVRFYTIVSILFSFVFLYIPRIDFFLTAISFLNVFILGFYIDRIDILKKLLGFYLMQMAVFLVLFLTPAHKGFSTLVDYPADWLMLLFIFGFNGYAFNLCKQDNLLKNKYRTSLIVAVVAPFVIGIIFKYLLLVPMPFEGMVIELIDAVWYR